MVSARFGWFRLALTPFGGLHILIKSCLVHLMQPTSIIMSFAFKTVFFTDSKVHTKNLWATNFEN